MNVVYQIKIGPYKQIGSTKNIKNRMSHHLRELSNNRHSNPFMQAVYNKYKSFSYRIIKECKTRDEAFNEEQILLYKYYGKSGYMMMSNKAYGSSSGKNSIMWGKKRPDQSQFMKNNNPMKNEIVVKKLSKKLKKLYNTKEKKKQFSDLWTKEKRKKQSITHSGSKNGRAKKVSCLETGKIFDTINDAAIYFNRTVGTISGWNKKKIKVKIHDR